MENERFCVYNQTCECFLSLGVVIADPSPTRFTRLMKRSEAKCEDGFWVEPPAGVRSFTVSMSAPLDLLYLDHGNRVVQVVESFPKPHISTVCAEAVSILALPAHTIYSSQTQTGNQLVICMAEEIAFRLRENTAADPELEEEAESNNKTEPISIRHLLPDGLDLDRRRSIRHAWPRLLAYDRNGARLAVHGIRDASATGLYLITEKRWPVGTQVTMTLQRTDNVRHTANVAISVQLRVVRWGVDGVGLKFVSPEVLEPAPWIEAL